MALTIGDALALGILPVAGRGTGLVPGLLLAGALNLVALAVLARPLARRLRRRRPDLPRVVAEDRAGSALLVAVTVALLAGGLAHRPARQAADRAFAAQERAVRAYVRAHAAPAYRANLDRLDTAQGAEQFFRTCVPGGPGQRPLCLLVETDRSPPLVRVDPSRTPNPGP